MSQTKQALFLVLFHILLKAMWPIQITSFREADMRGPNVDSMRRFNHQHAKMREVVENLFGRLKGRWRVLWMM